MSVKFFGGIGLILIHRSVVLAGDALVSRVFTLFQINSNLHFFPSTAPF